ncbi:uncharacterized protein F5147DRAFT_779470 [Suillus discolor]|uniref:Uncharacterized protein n=1 Tax=Suillus discolor TaxID=1912936 RepID=A0A9P7JNM8_9AGAM|nr:uncharacterized protein F5147DRAFT_779470 [Suillus discolor]KAG2093149.1 hypothetical protein F5147DRAFT_779470 [Suillus discolor]
MASSCTFHGIVGIQNASPCSLGRKRFWKMDGFVPLATDGEDTSNAMDLPASVFTFGGSTAPTEDGVYFINARLITTTAGDEPALELYCVDRIQPLDSACALSSVLIAGKVSRGTSELAESRSFDIDVMQYGIMAQQLARMRSILLLILASIRYVVCVHVITLGPSTNDVENRRHRDAAAPTPLKSFNWSGKGKKKRTSHTDSDAESESTHQKKGKKRQVIPAEGAMEEAAYSSSLNW